jgi:hypothetical protein
MPGQDGARGTSAFMKPNGRPERRKGPAATRNDQGQAKTQQRPAREDQGRTDASDHQSD